MRILRMLALLLGLVLLSEWCSAGLFSRKKVKLTDIQALTLYDGKMTTGRRAAPIPQLRCVGGDCYNAGVTVMQCYNRGSDGNDVQWECKAQLKKPYVLGVIQV